MSDPHVGTTALVQIKRWRRAYILAVCGILFAYAAVVTVLVSSGAPLDKLEYVVLCVLLMITAAALVNGWQAGVSLEHSVTCLESLRGGVGSAGANAVNSSSWLKDCETRLNERIQADRDDEENWHNTTLPSVAGIVDGVRLDADRAGHVLRWFSQAAVLAGLMGTLIGLIGAIGNAIAALKVEGEIGSGIGLALQGLEFCFVSSILGVATSFCLGWARQAYEGAADSHFSDLEHWFQTRIRILYAGWTDPLLQFCSAANAMVTVGEEIRQVGEDIKSLSETIKNNTTEVLNSTVAFFGTQLQQQLPQIADSVNKGLAAGTQKVLEDTKKHQDEFLNKYANQYTQFADNYAALQREAKAHLSQTLTADSNARQQVLADVSAALDALRQAGNDLGSSVATFTKNQEAETAKFCDSVGSAANNSAEHMNASAKALTTAVEALISKLKLQQEAEEQRRVALTESVEAASSRLEAAANSLAGSTEQVVGRATESASTIAKSLVNAVEDSAKRAENVTASLVRASDERIRQLATSRQELIASADAALRQVASHIESANNATQSNIAEQSRVNAELVRNMNSVVGSLGGGVKDIKEILEAVQNNVANALASVDKSVKATERMERVGDSLDRLDKHIAALVQGDQVEHEAFIKVVQQLIDQLPGQEKQVD